MFEGQRERLRHPPGAGVATHLAGVVAAACVVAGLVLLGMPAAAAVAAGVAVWAAVVAVGILRSRPARNPELHGLEEPWRRYLVEAVAARQRIDTAVSEVGTGQLRRRLEPVARRVRDGVAEVERIARHGSRLDRAVRELDDPGELRRRLQEARADRATPDGHVDALASQLAATERTVRSAVDTRQRLEVLGAALDEAVARAVELSPGQQDATGTASHRDDAGSAPHRDDTDSASHRDDAGSASLRDDDVASLRDDIDGLVRELTSLRVALDEARPDGDTGRAASTR